MERGIRLPGRGAERGPLGRQVRDLGQLHRHAGRRLRGQPRSWVRMRLADALLEAKAAGGRARLRPAALGRLPAATRGGSLPGMVGPAGGRTHEAAVLSRTSTGPRCSRTGTSRRSRATAGEAPSTSRSTDSTPASSRAMGGGPRPDGRAFPSRGAGVSGVEAENRRSSVFGHGSQRVRSGTNASGGTTC